MKRCNILLKLVCGALVCVGLGANAETDYGTNIVNNMGRTTGTEIGGPDQYNFLALENHHGPSGVPVGGVGVGCFNYAPNGRFTRIGINNWHADGGRNWTLGELPGSFLAIWQEQGGHAQLLHRDGKKYAGMPPAAKTIYRGLFPSAQCKVDDVASVRVWSGLVPHNVKDSSLPLVWIEVEVANSQERTQAVAVALSWEDVIGRGLRDVSGPDFLKRYTPDAWGRNNMPYGAFSRVPTTVSGYSVGDLSGIRQHSQPLRPVLKTFQNYNNEIAILAEKTPGAEITLLPAYAVDSPEEAWVSFRQEGRFKIAAGEASESALYAPEAGKEKASAIAVRLEVPARATRTVRFLISWFQPELLIDPAKDDPLTYFGKADYGRFYHRFFPSQTELVAYAQRERQRISEETVAWHQPILASTYPDWLKFKLINSAYVIYANSILNKAGDFTVMEGGMGGLAGTMDQRLSAHPFYQKFFTELDHSELELFGHTQGKKGQILHFCGHYYCGLASRDGTTPVPDNSMLDNTGGWLVQLAKDWQQTGDTAWLNQFRTRIDQCLDYLKASIKSKEFKIISGSTTYDDFWHPELYAYNASTYPAFLRAGAVLMDALGEPRRAKEYRRQAEVSASDAIRALYNGRFFAYGAKLDGSERRDDIMFSGQLAGQFLSRCFTWGDIFPQDVVRSSLLAQFETNIDRSRNYYAPKVWDIPGNKPMNDPRPGNHGASTCWPFYLESYTAMAAIQAGYVEDGLEIMRQIQLVHMRYGWAWTQNLWNPAELSYMSAPVTWFITDVLAGSGLDLPGETLYLAPVLRTGEQKAVLPIYFPRFWASVEADRSARTLRLTVTKVFDGPSITLRHVTAQPVGVASSEGKSFNIPPFRIKPGAVLDLSSHWDELTGANLQNPILPIKGASAKQYY
jgi:non-lysosomal glucosylceramidase